MITIIIVNFFKRNLLLKKFLRRQNVNTVNLSSEKLNRMKNHTKTFVAIKKTIKVIIFLKIYKK